MQEAFTQQINSLIQEKVEIKLKIQKNKKNFLFSLIFSDNLNQMLNLKNRNMKVI